MPRVSYWAVCAALTATLAYSQSPQNGEAAKPAQGKGPVPLIGVFMDFDTPPGATSLDIMEKEVQKLLKPSGLALDWHLLGDSRGKEPFSGLVVVKFRGKCRIQGWQDSAADYGPPSGKETTLGFTKVVNGHVVPFGEIECDRIRDALAYLEPAAGRKERQHALGVALARVVAHELYHMLAHTTAHAASGLAKATETLQDLATKPGMSFDSRDSRAIRQGFNPASGQ